MTRAYVTLGPVCPVCGRPLSVGSYANAVCAYHFAVRFIDGRANKIWCDYFHRGAVIERVDTFVDDDALDPVGF